jgi:hypothetical protein
MIKLPEKAKAKGTLATAALTGAGTMIFAQTMVFSVLNDLLLSMVVFGIGTLFGKFVWK